MTEMGEEARKGIPPHNEEAERGALGAMLMDGLRLVPVARRMRLKPESFFSVPNQTVFRAVLETFDGAKGVDLVTVGDWLKTHGKEVEVGGIRFLEDLVDATPTAAHGDHYLDVVRQKFILREVQRVASEIAFEVHRQDRGDEFLKQVPTRFMQIIDGVVEVKNNREEMAEIIQEWRDIHDKKTRAGLPIPFPRLHGIVGGLCPGLVIVAGRPSEGKTTFEDNLSSYVAGEGFAVGRITMDMTRKRLLARALCRKGGVSLPKFKFGYAGESNFSKVGAAADVLSEYPMFINEDDRELMGICTWARAMKMRHEMQMLTIDYVQQIEDAAATSWQGEHQTITKVSRVLKRLANELKIPVLLVSQLNREAEKSQRAPRLSDLRGSGSLEQDASVAMLVYRDPDIDRGYDKETGKRPTWVDVAKNQDGETGVVEFWMHQNYFLFEEATDGAFDLLKAEAEDAKAEKPARFGRQKKTESYGEIWDGTER
jgi:replicative DNA helicase